MGPDKCWLFTDANVWLAVWSSGMILPQGVMGVRGFIPRAALLLVPFGDHPRKLERYKIGMAPAQTPTNREVYLKLLFCSHYAFADKASFTCIKSQIRQKPNPLALWHGAASLNIPSLYQVASKKHHLSKMFKVLGEVAGIIQLPSSGGSKLMQMGMVIWRDFLWWSLDWCHI